MRIVEIQEFRAVTSEPHKLNELFGSDSQFSTWIDNHKSILKQHIFEPSDFPQSGMCNMPDPEGKADNALGIAQQQIFLPLKLNKK